MNLPSASDSTASLRSLDDSIEMHLGGGGGGGGISTKRFSFHY